MADHDIGDDSGVDAEDAFWGEPTAAMLTPSADLPACRDEDPAHPAALTASYPDPPDYQHPEADDG